MFGASTLGFRFQSDRGARKKDVLVFFDPLTDAPGGNTNYYVTSGDVNPATELWPKIRDREIALGFTPTLVSSYSALAALNLDDYAHAWDIGYASPYLTNPNDPTSLLTSYLQNNGALLLLGENAYFGVRDNAIDDFVTGLGGGSISRSSNNYYWAVDSTVAPAFLQANLNDLVTFSRPGTFDTYGTGTPITTPFVDNEYVAVMWETSSLASATRGAVISILDINFVTDTYYDPDFIDNMCVCLNRK
jgi:hypothetical protein